MNAKEKFWAKNLIHAAVVKHGRTFNVFHDMHDKRMWVLETGAHKTMNRREFRKWVKELGGHIYEPLKTGEYYDIRGEKQKLWGID